MIEISVIIASVESSQSIERCIESVRVAVAGRSSEIVVADASRDASADIAMRMLGPAGVIRCAPGTLTPELWAAGIARSKGRVIALTTGHFAVEPTWVWSLESALEEGHVGAAGRIALAALRQHRRGRRLLH